MTDYRPEVGDRAEIRKIFVESDILKFSELSEDYNPIHLDPQYAKESVFGRQIVHGMLVASLFSGLLGERLPGKGTIYLGQTITFLKPVFISEEVIASVEISHIREDKPIFTLLTKCETESNGVVIEGEAVVLNSMFNMENAK
ncbi:MaoC family dehydratase [Gemmatimonadota bacterium]